MLKYKNRIEIELKEKFIHLCLVTQNARESADRWLRAGSLTSWQGHAHL